MLDLQCPRSRSRSDPVECCITVSFKHVMVSPGPVLWAGHRQMCHALLGGSFWGSINTTTTCIIFRYKVFNKFED